jgi:hypothetical protein
MNRGNESSNTTGNTGANVELARAENGPGPYNARGRFWGVYPTHDEVNGIENREAAMQIVSNNTRTIYNMAEKYNIDAMVLASVLYQERRHRNVFDDIDERLGDPRGSTIGPGQMTRKAFHDMVDQKRLVLDPEQSKEYAKDREGFAFRFLTNETTGIQATAALIRANMDRQHSWGKYDQAIGSDNNPNTLSLGQYVYGAALYSSSGLNAPGKDAPANQREFDRRGPTTDQIDLRNNDISGLEGLNRSQSMINAFRYLPDVYQALHGTRFEAPQNLSDYFNDTRILRPGNNRRSSLDDTPENGGHTVASNGSDRNTPALSNSAPLASTAAAFGPQGQSSRDTFDAITARLQTQAPNLGEQKITEVAADLTPKSMAAGHRDIALTINEQGRVFAYDPNRPSAQTVYSDPQSLNPETIAQNAGKARDQPQPQTTVALAPDPQNPHPVVEPKSRNM